ncbi:MAG TPA: YceI family protein [Pseudonocardiaceae bacterium]|nr:YceI family protein [Pseudonocardiaceae bacterium]
MASDGQHHSVGPDRGRLTLHTSRVGLAASAGHDLTIEVATWSGEVVVAADPANSTVAITADLGSLRVVEGKGGVKPLSDRDKREIAGTARKTLDTDRHPEIRFTSNNVGTTDGGGTVTGTLHMRGQDRPLVLQVTDLGNGRYRATGDVIQTEYGIKPYSGFFGALKLADKVGVVAELDLSGPSA